VSGGPGHVTNGIGDGLHERRLAALLMDFNHGYH
jgi:hypothetical protein